MRPNIEELVKKSGPKGAPKTSTHDGLKAAAEDLLDAIKANDVDATASALRRAFRIADAMPHEEGPHGNEEE